MCQGLSDLLIGVSGSCFLLQRETEIENLHAPITQQKDVRRLDVAVRDAPIVRGSETPGNLSRDIQSRPHGQSTILEPRAKCLALQELGNDVDHAAFAADVVESEDVGMIQRCDRSCFTIETAQRGSSIADNGAQHLDRHIAPESRIVGPVDLAHTARSERRQDFIRSEPRSWQRCHRRPTWKLSRLLFSGRQRERAVI